MREAEGSREYRQREPILSCDKSDRSLGRCASCGQCCESNHEVSQREFDEQSNGMVESTLDQRLRKDEEGRGGEGTRKRRRRAGDW